MFNPRREAVSVARVYSRDPANGHWSVLAVDGHAFSLLPASAGRGPAMAMRSNRHWVLVCAPAVAARVNSRTVLGGLRVLRDRDAIQLEASEPLFLCTVQSPSVQVFPGLGREVYCPRCKQVLEPGCHAVRCPNPDCGTWSHQHEELMCWSYDKGCAACQHPTAFDANALWTPEDL